MLAVLLHVLYCTFVSAPVHRQGSLSLCHFFIQGLTGLRGPLNLVKGDAMKKTFIAALAALASITCSAAPFVHAGPGPTSTTTTSRFQNNNDGTMTDTTTNLIWVKDGSASGSKNWADAAAWCGALASGSAGLTDGSAAGDWRLPARAELLGLASGWTGNDAAEWLNSQGFTNTQYLYWSSEQYTESADYAWVVTFITGTDGGLLKTQQAYARAVRAATTTTSIVPTTTTSVPPRFQDNKDGTITDTSTDLVWLKDGSAAGEKTWFMAKAWCDALASGTAGLTDGSAAGDWRLPGKDEYLGLISGWSGMYPATWLDSQGFTNTQIDDYWIQDATIASYFVAPIIDKNGNYTSVGSAAPIPTRPVRAPCPATKALGPNNPKLNNLRAFRDNTLARCAIGRSVIHLYYRNAGSMTAALERSPALRSFTKNALEFLAPMAGNR